MATPKQDSTPLTQDDLVTINRSLQALSEAERVAERAAQAGIDMSEQKKQIVDQRNQLMKLKQAFFPGR